MNTLLWIGHVTALTVVAAGLLRDRWNAVRSWLFLSNVILLATYYWPAALLGLQFSRDAVLAIVLGHLGLTVGFLLGAAIDRTVLQRLALRGPPLGLRLPSDSYLTLGFVIGLAGYGLLYAARGVPLFAPNIDVARADLVAGAGPIFVPSTTLLATAVWVALLRDQYRRAVGFGAVGAACMMLSGWRGPMLIMLLSGLFLLAWRRRLTTAGVVVGALGLVFVGFVGALRAALSGQAYQGLDIPGGEGPNAAVAGAISLALRFVEQGSNFQIAIEHFGAEKLGGRGLLMDLSFMLPGTNLTLENYMREEFARWEGGGGMPITMFGALFADFGLAGVLIGSALTAAGQACLSAVLVRASHWNTVYLLPLGFLSTFWILGMLGSYFGNFIPFTVSFGLGVLLIVGLYSSDLARVVGLRHVPAADLP